MQILWLFLFIGVIQCDNGNILVPEDYSSLNVPCYYEYLTIQELAVKSAYIASYESVTSANINMKSGIKELDDGSKDNLNGQSQDYSNFNGVQDMISTLKQSQEEEAKAKVCSTIYMTLNYYIGGDKVKDTGVKLGESNDEKSAQSIIFKQRCKSSYENFIAQVETLKQKHANSNGNVGYAQKADTFLEVKREMDESDIFTSNRNAYALGSGSNLCKGTPSTQSSLLEIYQTSNVAGFFNIRNDAVKLFKITAIHLHSLYKIGMDTIYANSRCSTPEEQSLRMALWTYLNVARVDADFMLHRLIVHILYIQSNAEKTYGKESKEYITILDILFQRTNIKLLMIIMSTQSAYRRAIAITSDGYVTEMNYGAYGTCQIDQIYNAFIWRCSKVSTFDFRVLNVNSFPYPTIENFAPDGMYCLKANTLLLQSVVCYLNFLLIKFSTTIGCTETWTYIQMSFEELEMSFMSLKYSATRNKLLSLSYATYVHMSVKSNNNFDVKQTMNIIGHDIISVLATHSKDLICSLSLVESYIDTNNKKAIKPVSYAPEVTQKKSSYISGSQSNTRVNNNNNSPDNTISSTTRTSYISPASNTLVNNNNKSPDSTTPITQSGTIANVQPSRSTDFQNVETPVVLNTPNQVKDYLIYFQQSVTTKVTTVIESTSQLKNTEQEYVKLNLILIQQTKAIFDVNYEYLSMITNNMLVHITDTLSENAEDYQQAIVSLHKDLEEKKTCLLSFVKTPIIRCHHLTTSTNVNEYAKIPISISYSDYVVSLFQFFEEDYNGILGNDVTVETYITNCKALFIKVHDKVSLGLQKTTNDNYKSILVCQLEETLKVFKKTCEHFEAQISQTLSIVQKFGEESVNNYYDDCKNRMEAICSVYSTVLTTCYQYSKKPEYVSVLESDYYVLVSQTTIISYAQVETLETVTEVTEVTEVVKAEVS